MQLLGDNRAKNYYLDDFFYRNDGGNFLASFLLRIKQCLDEK